MTIQVMDADDAQRCVDSIAMPAEPLAISALPALRVFVVNKSANDFSIHHGRLIAANKR